MKHFFFISLLLFILFIFHATDVRAADWYVRPSGGTGSGTSWTDAWNGLSGIEWVSVAPGDTICIAGGSYSSLTIGKSGNASNRITLKRATVGSPCAAGEGWNSSYDNQVVINGGIVFNNTANGNYVTIDGVVDNGIKTVVGDGGAGVNFERGATNVELKYIEMVGPGNITYTIECRGIDVTPWNGTSFENTVYLLVSHGNLHDCPTLMQTVNTVDYLTVEYTKFHDANAINSQQWHPNLFFEGGSDNGVIRYSEFYNIVAEGLFFTYGGQDNWKIYGNIFRDGYPDSTGRGIEFHQDFSYTNFQVYNNTFVNLTTFSGFAARGSVTGTAYNNIFYNAPAWWSSISHDYNWFYGSGSQSEPHIQNGSGNPFMNISVNDYSLSAETNTGTVLPPPYDLDMNGNIRGLDGVWDIGAYEFISSAPDTTPPSAPTGLTIN